MEQQKMKLLKRMLNIVDIVVEICYFHTNMSLLVFHVHSTLSKENTNSLEYNKIKNFYQSIKICRSQIFLHLHRFI